MRFLARCLVGTCLFISSAAISSPAATVQFTLDIGSGTFTLYARASAGDNGGIALYSVPLTGSILTLDHRSPYAVSSANFFPAGFRNLRSADGETFVVAGQPLTGPAENYLYGIGQTSNSMFGLGIPVAGLPDASADVAWSAPFVIATGTFNTSGTPPNFLLPNPDMIAIVFATAGNSSDRINATINTSVGFINKPPAVVPIELNLTANTQFVEQQLLSSGGQSLSWSNLAAASGNAAIASTLIPQGLFQWNTSGSPKGPNDVYEWYATVGTTLGNSSVAGTGLALRIRFIPEPARSTPFLCAIGLAAVATRGRSVAVNRVERLLTPR